MDRFEWILHRISRFGVYFGGLFLVGGLLLLMGNIFGRITHFVIPGSYELFELIMLVPVACALFYTALERTHVSVTFLTSRLPGKIQVIASVFSELLALIVWSIMGWASYEIAVENGLDEVTDVLEMPVLPFRVIWIVCLILFSLTYLLYLIKTVRRYNEK